MTQQASNAAQPLYTITGQTPTGVQDTSGRFTPGYQISFKTRSGFSGNVYVTAEQLTPDAVRAKVVAAAQNLEAIAGLNG